MNKIENFKRNVVEDSFYTYLWLIMLFILNILWFFNLGPNSLMGDDLVNWNYYQETPNFFDAVIANHEFGKYRVVFNIFNFFLFNFFGGDAHLFFVFNILFNFFILVIFFLIIKKITTNNVISFCFSLLYLTARFSYYNVLQITGLLESLSIFWLLLMIYFSIKYFFERNVVFLYSMLFINGLIIFTHERFIVLLPCILSVIYFGPEDVIKGIKKKMFIVALALFPLFLNFFVKVIIFKMNFLEGTAGTSIQINIVLIVNFLKNGLLNMFGLNIGPEYLSAVSFGDLDLYVKVISYLIVFCTCLVLLLAGFNFRRMKNEDRIKQIKIFIIFSFLFGSLILSSSITIRQEFRWLYAPYLVFLLYLAYLISRNLISTKRYIFVFVFLGLILFNNIEYRRHLNNIFFIYSQKMADSFYERSIKKYGYENRIFVLEKFDSVDWVIPKDLFLKPYSKNSVIVYVDDICNVNFKEMNQKNISLYKLNWTGKKIDEITF